jgi:tetratricopeptide (TPR) repeat protein
LRESPADPFRQESLSNTLLNTVCLLASWEQTVEHEPLFRRIVELDRAAVHTAPKDASLSAELALALGVQGMFFLEVGQLPQAEATVREAVQIHETVLAGGQLRHSVERYVARNYVNLGRVLVAAGKTGEAEQAYQKAATLFDRMVLDLPQSVYPGLDLGRSLPYLASLLEHLGRGQEAVEVRLRVIRVYESLQAKFAGNTEHRHELVGSYLELARLLCGLGRQTEAAELYRKALALEVDDPVAHNELAWFLVMNPEPGLRDAARAVRLARKSVTARPESANYRNTLGVAHYRNGDDRAAVAELERAMGLEAGGTPHDWFFLAMAHWRLGDRDQARTYLDRSEQWMAKRNSRDDELCRIRAEARATLAEPAPG